jgi:hypothetical protein
LQAGSAQAKQLADIWAQQYRQVNPEYIVNVGFGMIVLCQIGLSAYIQRWKALPICYCSAAMKQAFFEQYESLLASSRTLI